MHAKTPHAKTPHAKRLLVVALLVAAGATACGSSSKGAASNGATSPGQTSGATTSAPKGGSPGAAPTTAAKISGSGSGDFCSFAQQDQNAFKAPNPGSTSADSLKQEMQNLGPELQHAESVAPDAIKGDFQTFVTAFAPYLKALADANYDFTKINFASLQGIDTPQVKAASEHIEQYFEQVCHIKTPTT